MKRAGRWVGVLFLACVLGWVVLRARMAVVTVRFDSRRPGAVVDYLFVTVGGTKQYVEGLKSGEEERFVLSPDARESLVMGFWIGAHNGGWEGPVLHPRQRLDVLLDDDGQVSWRECDWPCW